MSARVILFFHVSIFGRKNPNRSLLIKAGTQKQRTRLWFFSFAKAGIRRKTETGIRKHCKAWHIFDNRARVTGEHRKISIPDIKKDWWKTLSITRKEDPSKFYTSPGDVFLNTGSDRSSQRKNFANNFATRNDFLIESRGEYTPELWPQLDRNRAPEIIRAGFAWNLDGRSPGTPPTNTMIAVNERERISIRAQKKAIDAKNTGSAARNNFLLHRRARRSAAVRNVIPKAYLAINWQPLRLEAQFTCRELRFPTPPQQRNNREIRVLLTTSHVFWPNERRKRAFSLPISRPIFNALGGKCKRESQRGAGGVRHGRPGKSARSITSHGNFHANGSPTLSDPRKKTLCKGSDAQWIPCSKQPPKVPMPDGRCDSA
jgi:hypothetical protein